MPRAASSTSFSSARLPKNETVKPMANIRTQHRSRGEQNPLQRAGLGAAAAGAQRGLIVLNHSCKKAAQKQPLRDFPRARRPTGAAGAAGRSSCLEKSCGAAGRFKRRSLGGRRTRRRHGRILHDDGTNAGEIKTSQKRADSQLAWPAEIHEELHQAVAQLAELARKLIRARNFLRIVFPRQESDAVIRQRIEYCIKCSTEPFAFLLGVNAACILLPQRQRCAQHLSGFFRRQIAHEILEKRQPVHLGKQHVHRETDAEFLG